VIMEIRPAWMRHYYVILYMHAMNRVPSSRNTGLWAPRRHLVPRRSSRLPGGCG
jgi:hypothetical protein